MFRASSECASSHSYRKTLAARETSFVRLDHSVYPQVVSVMKDVRGRGSLLGGGKGPSLLPMKPVTVLSHHKSQLRIGKIAVQGVA